MCLNVYKMLYNECKYDFLESLRLHLEVLNPKLKMLLK